MKKAFIGLTSVKSLFDNYKSLTIISAFLTISMCVSAQMQYDSTRVLQNINADGYSYKNLELRGKLRLWRDTFPMAFKDSGSIAYKNQNIYIWTGRSWKQPGSSFDTVRTIFSSNSSISTGYTTFRDSIDLKVDTNVIKPIVQNYITTIVNALDTATDPNAFNSKTYYIVSGDTLGFILTTGAGAQDTTLYVTSGGGSNIGTSDLTTTNDLRTLNLKTDGAFRILGTGGSNDIEFKIDQATGTLSYPDGGSGLFQINKSILPVMKVRGDAEIDSLRIGTTDKLGLALHVVGDGTNTAAFMNGNVGIGTTTPAATLQIASTDSNVLKLSGLINTVLATDSSLVIGTDGNVKKAARSTAGGAAAAGTLTGTTLASNVVSSSLTGVGTIVSGVWHGTAIDTLYSSGVSNINVNSPLVNLAQGKGYLITADTGIAPTKLVTGYDLYKVRDSLPITSSGTYIPTFASKVNMDSIRYENWMYVRVGNTVTVSGYIYMDATTAATNTTCTATLPIASTISNIWDLVGSGQAEDNAATRGLIFKGGTNLASLVFTVVSSGPRSYYFSFTYKIV